MLPFQFFYDHELEIMTSKNFEIQPHHFIELPLQLWFVSFLFSTSVQWELRIYIKKKAKSSLIYLLSDSAGSFAAAHLQMCMQQVSFTCQGSSRTSWNRPTVVPSRSGRANYPGVVPLLFSLC